MEASLDIEPSLHDYVRIIQKRKWLVAAVVSVITISSTVYTYTRIPLYRAQGVVKFEPPGVRIVGMDNSNFDQFSSMQTQLRILGSLEMNERVRLKLPNAEGFSAARLPDSNMISLSATSRDPEAAAAVVSVAMDVYAERDAEERSLSFKKSLADIGTRKAEIENSLSQLEDKRRSYLETHQGTGMGSTLNGTLLELEQRRREMLKKFTPEHPDVIAVDSRITNVRARLSVVPGQDIDLERLTRDIKVNEEVYIGLSRQMEEAKVSLASMPQFVTAISRPTVPTAPFYPNKRANNMLGCIFGLVLGLVSALMLESLDISISTLEEIEKVLGVPVLGVVPHLGSESRWLAFKTKLLRKQRYPLEAFRSLLLFHQKSKSPIIEVYHHLRSNVQSQLPGVKNLVLTFTSTGVAEGKTLTSTNFCLAAAHAGLKVLLIGSDIRRPVIYRIFGVPKKPGLMEVLGQRETWEDSIRGTVDFLMGEIDLDKLLSFSGIDNFKLMTSGTSSAADIVNVFSSAALPEFIKAVRPRFDLIVFDCPPALLFVDALLIGAHTDGVVLIYQSGKMARQALRRVKDQMQSAKVNILGVVLNDMRTSEMGPGYAYYYGYGHYAKKEEA